VLVSVIIPTYNTGRFLAQAVESALCQSHSPIEIVVVNDGSTDNTDEVVAPYLDRIKYICQENRGLSAARNAGFLASRGDFVCFLDADDILLPDKFTRQLAVFERELDLGIVISGYIDVEEDGKIAIQTVAKRWHRDALDHLLNHEVFPPHTALIRRQVLESVALFPEDIDTAESQEDWQLWLDLALNGVAFTSVPEPTCKFRNRQGSIRSNPLKHLDGARRVVRWLRAHPKAGRYRARIERLAAIVEMERVAAAWRTGHKDIAAETLATSVRASQRFWQEPLTYLRLFERTLTLAESAKWQERCDLAWFEKRVIGEILPLGVVRLGEPEYRRLSAAAHLALSDLAYGERDARTRRHAVACALEQSRGACMTRDGRSSLVRGLAGPTLTGKVKRVLGFCQ
jgi:glycosyltransferase involved in cell wall biosynthesis